MVRKNILRGRRSFFREEEAENHGSTLEPGNERPEKQEHGDHYPKEEERGGHVQKEERDRDMVQMRENDEMKIEEE